MASPAQSLSPTARRSFDVRPHVRVAPVWFAIIVPVVSAAGATMAYIIAQPLLALIIAVLGDLVIIPIAIYLRRTDNSADAPFSTHPARRR